VPSGIRQEFELKNAHHDCQDCHLDKDFNNSTGNDNNLSCSSHGNNSHNDNSERKERNDQSRENLPEQENKSTLGGDHSGLIIGGIITASLISLATVLVVKKRKK
jgi:hypothetical protein